MDRLFALLNELFWLKQFIIEKYGEEHEGGVALSMLIEEIGDHLLHFADDQLTPATRYPNAH